MNLLKFFLITALHISYASVWAQPFGSATVESERLKDLSRYAEELRGSIEQMESEQRNLLSTNHSSVKSNAEALKLRETVEVFERNLEYFYDTLKASNVLFSAVAIAMNVDDKSKQTTVAFHISNICMRMPGKFMGAVGHNQANETLRMIHSIDREHLTERQATLVSKSLATAHSLREAMSKLCARGSDPKNWAVR